MAKRRKPRYQQEAEALAREQESARRLVEEKRAEEEGRRIKADLSQQAPNNSYGPQLLYYEDKEFTCRDCGRVELWTAKQQQWWYEVAKGAIYSTAVRCRACRRTRRGESTSGPLDQGPAEGTNERG